MLMNDRLMDALMVFAMALTISSSEINSVEMAREHAYTTLALSNDYYSWQKEYDQVCNSGKAGGVANAIWIISKEHSVNIDEAKEICVDMIRRSHRKFCDERKRVRTESGYKVSEDLSKYLVALEMCVSGNFIWSQYSERYNLKEPDGHVEAMRHLAVPATCSSCGSSTATLTPRTSDLEE